jgi:hypothetical protein
LRFLSRLLDTAGLSIVISRRTLLHFHAHSGGSYTFKQKGKGGAEGESGFATEAIEAEGPSG